MTKRLLTLLFSLSVLTSVTFSATYVVPDDFPSIQSAIDAAVTGDSIFVRKGVYRENLYISGKGLYISSFFTTPGLDNMRETIIDGGKMGTVMEIYDCADTNTLRGFTLCNGYHDHGAGIYSWHGILKLNDLVIRENATEMVQWSGGGGIYGSGSYFDIRNVYIYDNKAYDFGGGLSLRSGSVCYGVDMTINGNIVSGGGHSKGGGIYADYSSELYLERSVIEGNLAAAWGGAIACADDALISLVNLTITNNFAGAGGGALYCCYADSRIFVGNCIVYNNFANIGYAMDQEVYFDDIGDKNQIVFCYSDIKGGLSNMYIPSHSHATELEGNIDEMPYFNPDLTLASPSFCIDAGTDQYTYWGEELINIPPDQYYGAMPDMGAYENWDVILQLPDMVPASMDWTKLYPNPVNQTLNVEITDPGSKKVELSLYDEKGALCLQDHFSVCKTGKSILTLSLASFSPGNYTLTIHSQTRHSTKKLIVF